MAFPPGLGHFFFFFCTGYGAEAIHSFLPIIFSCGFGSLEIFSAQSKLEEFMESVHCSWTICLETNNSIEKVT